jgi:serine/threonine protein kinase
MGSYTDPKYFGIIMAPVADHDLYAFYQLVTTENTPLLRSFFGCLAGALNFLHEVKIRHRDIKPQNILVKGPHVYLTDFGISLNWENLSRSTTTEDTAKSLLYCAPEVARFEKRNTSADVWSLGCVFVEMLTVIKGRTIEEQRQFFKQRTDNPRFYENISGAQEWVKQLQQMDPSQTSDSFVADCILRLIKDNPNERMRTVELYNEISRYQNLEKGEGNSLCGECCVSDTLSVSDSGSDGDPFASTTEP